MRCDQRDLEVDCSCAVHGDRNSNAHKVMLFEKFPITAVSLLVSKFVLDIITIWSVFCKGSKGFSLPPPDDNSAKGTHASRTLCPIKLARKSSD